MMKWMGRRVVVTGMGVVSPVGNTVQAAWKNILLGQSGVDYITGFDPSEYATHFAAEVNNFDPTLYMPKKEVRRYSPFIQYAVAASHQAFSDAGFTVGETNSERFGVIIGSGIGGIKFIEDTSDVLRRHGPKKVSPFFIPGCIVNMCSGVVSIALKCKGPNVSMVSACASGAHSIGYAARSIACGDSDVIIAGGAEYANSPCGLGGFCSMRALSTRNSDPKAASRPWDKDRDGFVLGAGAGVLVLEEYEHAKARGANIVAELKGFGMSSDAHHITSPDPDGMKLSMQHALTNASLNASDIDYINAHGTSTPLGDVAEHSAIKSLLGSHSNNIAMSSTKSMTGHLLGAAGGLESVFSCLAIRDQVAPPTINLDNPELGCDMNLVPNTAQEREIKTVLSNSFGFGGTNVSLIFTSV